MIDGQCVSVLISSRDRPQLLHDVLLSVLQGEDLPDEVVVVDQSDDDNPLLERLVPPEGVRLRHVRSRTTGLSRSRNLAFCLARNPVVAVVDDDCLVAPDWLGKIVRALVQAGPDAVVTGRVLAGPAESDGAFAPSLHTANTPREYEGRTPVDPLATFNLALHTSSFAHIGGFDDRLGPGTRFPSAEDNDFGHRLLQAGYRIVFEPRAVVRHRAWRESAGYVPLRYAYGRGQGGYYAKHLIARDSYMAVKFLHALRRRVERAREGDRKVATGEAAWLLGWTVGAAEWLLSAVVGGVSNRAEQPNLVEACERPDGAPREAVDGQYDASRRRAAVGQRRNAEPERK